MSYRTIQRRLRALGSTIRLNQKKHILLQELEDATESNVGLIELRDPDEIREFTSSIVDRPDSICGTLGSSQYWQGLLTWPVDIVVKAIHEGTVAGFVLIRTNYDCTSTGCRTYKTGNSLYIEVICSTVTGFGTRLMEYVKRLARKEQKNRIHLSALFDVVSYYADKHQFHISSDCYPQKETEIELLSELRKNTHSINKRRKELTHTMKQKPTKSVKDSIKSERGQLTIRKKLIKQQETEVLDTFRSVSTYQLKHPDQSATAENVMDEGVFMSFCL